MKRILLILFLIPGFLAAQSFDEKVKQVISSDSLPAGIRTGKSMVLLEVSGNTPWQEAANEIHSELIKGGVDPVTYYSFDIIYSGHEVTRSFVNDLSAREFSNLILIKHNPNELQIAITHFDINFFNDQQQQGWQKRGELKNILNQLYVRLANSGLDRENFLIADQAEEGVLTSPIKGKRAEFFSLSVDGTKTAVPHFGDKLLDQELRAVMDGEFPFDYDLVDPLIEEEELKKQGYQYVLYFVQGEGQTVRRFLDYQSDEESNAYATINYQNGKSEVRTLPITRKVYKYYLKHLISGTTYLGTEWDAGENWRQALINHIRSFKKGTQR